MLISCSLDHVRTMSIAAMPPPQTLPWQSEGHPSLHLSHWFLAPRTVRETRPLSWTTLSIVICSIFFSKFTVVINYHRPNISSIPAYVLAFLSKDSGYIYTIASSRSSCINGTACLLVLFASSDRPVIRLKDVQLGIKTQLFKHLTTANS